MNRKFGGEIKKRELLDVVPTLKNNIKADVGEVFVSRESGLLSFKAAQSTVITIPLGIIPANGESTLAIASMYGFRYSGGIAEDITLPDNSSIEYNGPLVLLGNSILTIPSNTTLTIL